MLQTLTASHEAARQVGWKEVAAIEQEISKDREQLGDSREDNVRQQTKLWKLVQESVDQNGRRLAELFDELPCRETYPDYYMLIQKPISLQCIWQRIKQDPAMHVLQGAGQQGYAAMSDFAEDMALLFANARTYNLEVSQVVADANHMEAMIKKAYKKVFLKRNKRT